MAAKAPHQGTLVARATRRNVKNAQYRLTVLGAPQHDHRVVLEQKQAVLIETQSIIVPTPALPPVHPAPDRLPPISGPKTPVPVPVPGYAWGCPLLLNPLECKPDSKHHYPPPLAGKGSFLFRLEHLNLWQPLY